MKRTVLRSRGFGMLLAVGLLAWGVGHPAPAWSHDSCSLKTLKGTYLFTCHGVQGSGQTAFGAAGRETFHGDGTMDGVLTATDKDNVQHHYSYPGTYTVNPDCTGTVTEGDEIIGVVHIDMYFAPDAAELDYVVTDPGFVDSYVERRVGH
jgi:hypothetical protein